MDGEIATITLLDTWDTEVRWKVDQKRLHASLHLPSRWLYSSTFFKILFALQTDIDLSQERYMQTGDAYLLLYSITDRSSFLRASELRITLRRFRPARHTPIILVGNKCDLVRRREVSTNGKEIQSLYCKVNVTLRFLTPWSSPCFRWPCLCCCVWLQVHWDLSCHAAQCVGGFPRHCPTAAFAPRLQRRQQTS